MTAKMRLYESGMVRWNPDCAVPFIVKSGQESELVSQGPFENGEQFSFLDEPLDDHRGISFRGTRMWKNDETIGSYERLHAQGHFETNLFNFTGESIRLIRLAHVPDAGLFHRFVVEAGKLEWEDDTVLRSSREFIRFTSGIYGPWSEGIREESGDRSHYEVAVGMREGYLDGKFIEVVAPGSSPEDARLRASALLGYVTLILGPGAFGKTVVDAGIDASVGRVETYTLYTDDTLGFRVSIDDFALDTGLADLYLLAGKTGNRRLLKALDRYRQASSATSEELAFAAIVSAIDAVVSDFYREKGGGAIEEQRANLADEFAKEHLSGVDKDTTNRIRNMFISPSFLDKFTIYARHHDLPEKSHQEFQRLKEPRNDLFHAASSESVHVALPHARRLLQRIICAESGIDSRKVWRFDRGFATAGTWTLSQFGWN